MIYFDNAATTLPKPPEVIRAVTEGINALGNPSRGAHGAALNSLRLMLDTRQAVCDMFNVGSPMQVAFTAGATAAINIAISGVRGHIVTTAAEHNSVLRPLFRRGNFTVLPLDGCGRLDIASLRAAIKSDTEAVVMCHASNLTGNIFDIKAAGEICKQKEIRFIVDAAQTAGLIDIDMLGCGISALCVSGHKSLYGPQGTGVICLSPDYQPSPLIIGGSGQDSFATAHPTAMPDALEAGTQNMPGIAGLFAGISYVKSMGGRVFEDADRLAKRFINSIESDGQISGRIIWYGDLKAKLRLPVVALNIQGRDSAAVAAVLFERYGIAVRAGAHCAPFMHKALNTCGTGAVRFSFSHFNTEEEIGATAAAIKEIINGSKFF